LRRAPTTRWAPFECNEEGNKQIAAYLASMGFPQAVIDLQLKADPCCLNYIDHAEAEALGC
jgi:hypothetical protein